MSRIRQHNLHVILEAASAEFAAKGFDASQTRDIAARAAVPKANLYYYFRSKENLYAKVLLGFVEPLLEASAVLRESDDPVTGEPAGLPSPHGSGSPGNIRTLRRCSVGSCYWERRQLPEECRDLLYAEARRNVECLRSWIDRGLLAPVDPEHLMLFIWSATRTYTNLGWQMAHITGRETPRDEDYRMQRRPLPDWCWVVWGRCVVREAEVS